MDLATIDARISDLETRAAALLLNWDDDSPAIRTMKRAEAEAAMAAVEMLQAIRKTIREADHD